MSIPNEDVTWASASVNNGANSTPNKAEPDSIKRIEGFGYPEKPSRSEMNWWMNAVGKWVNYFNQALPQAGINKNFLQDQTNTAGLNFAIESGKVFLGSGDPLQIPTKVITLPASSTRYIYLDLTEAALANMPKAAAAWPSTQYIPLFKVITGASSITSVEDWRTWAIQGGGGSGGTIPEDVEFTGVTGSTLNSGNGMTLTGLLETPNLNVWVFKNGSRLLDTEFAVPTSSSITLTDASVSGDEWKVVKLGSIDTIANKVETKYATHGQTTFTLESLADNKALTIYVNGVYQASGFTFASSNQVVFSTGLAASDRVDFVKNVNAGDLLSASIATQPEVDAGVVTNKFVTPLTLDGLLDQIFPIGMMAFWPKNAVPVGGRFRERNGDAILISSYPAFAALIYVGDSNNATAEFGYRCTNPANPTNTRSVAGTYIVLPDDRGLFERGWDHVSAFGGYQADAFQNITGTLNNVVTAAPAGVNPGGAGALTYIGSEAAGAAGINNFVGSALLDTSASPSLRTANETRPKNRAYLPIIRVL